MTTDATKFWIYDPSILFTDLHLIPTSDMSSNQKLNAATRLALAISGVLYAMEYNGWLTFLLVSVLLIIVVGFGMNSAKGETPTREGFSIVPTHIGDDFEQTIVAPTYAEEWHSFVPEFNHYENPETLSPPFEEPIRPQSYPYGQYLTRTNLLPNDEFVVQQNLNGGSRQAREYVSNKFLEHDIANRENMTRIFKKTLERRFRHGSPTYDVFSPFHSY